MVKLQKQTHNHQTKPKRLSCLLSCFRFSGKVSDTKSGDKGKKRISWFFRSKSTNSGTHKTVPVDVSPEKLKPKSIEAQAKSKSKNIKSKSNRLQDKGKLWDISPIPAPDQPADSDFNHSVNNSLEIKYESKEDKILPGNEKLIDSSIKDDTSKRRSSQKQEKKYKRASSQGKESDSAEVHQTATLVSHSTSFKSQSQPRKNDDGAGKFDPLVGLSVIMVTLIVMVIWGRLCAILCTSAWLYFIPFYRNSVISGVENKTTIEKVRIDSMESKRRVVLEGFLERNGRSQFVIL